MGDFSVNLVNWNDDKNAGNFLDATLLSSYHYHPNKN